MLPIWRKTSNIPRLSLSRLWAGESLLRLLFNFCNQRGQKETTNNQSIWQKLTDLGSDWWGQVFVDGVGELVDQDVVGPVVGVALITQDVVLQNSTGVATYTCKRAVLPAVKRTRRWAGPGANVWRMNQWNYSRYRETINLWKRENCNTEKPMKLQYVSKESINGKKKQ